MPIQHFYTQTVADGTATSLVRPSDWNSAHNMVFNLSGNTLGSSQLVGSDVTFVGGNNITLSADTAADKLVFIGPAAGGATLSFMEPTPLVGTANSSLGQNSLYFVPIKPQNNVTMTAVNMLVSLSCTTSNISHAVSQTLSYGLYSLGTGASTSQLLLMATSSIAIMASYSSNLTGRYTISQGANSTTYSSPGQASTSVWLGQRIMAYPMETLLEAGKEYYFCMAQSTASVGNTAALRMSHVVLNNMTNGSFGRLAPNGITASNSSIIPNFNGFIYSATSNAWPSTIALSQRSIQSNIRMYVQLDA